MPILGRGDCTCLWYEQTCCLAWNDPPKPVGVIKGDDYICKFGLGVCTSGLKKNYDMKDLFSAVCQIFVCKETCQLPFGNKHPRCMCACCFIGCYPEPGCAVHPPAWAGGAPPAAIEMAR
eukprot:jgi/Chrpa1/12548/Chrysochromulina_OHIO_Genome00020662-RA